MSTVIETALRTRPGRGAHWAPLLIAMLFLLWTGPGARSLDEWVRAR